MDNARTQPLVVECPVNCMARSKHAVAIAISEKNQETHSAIDDGSIDLRPPPTIHLFLCAFDEADRGGSYVPAAID